MSISRRLRHLALTGIFLFGLAPASPAQQYAGDTGSMDAILAALYDVISGPAGEERDSLRFVNLFQPGARLIATYPDSTGNYQPRFMEPGAFISNMKGFTRRNAFYEVEIARRTQRFDHIAHVFSTYETYREPGGKAFMRGINSIQLFFDGSRWWVVNIYWQPESPTAPLPRKYIKKIK